ncbi:hypothetical protein BN946_scf184939.g7 [Trametes cinnabarina]|uniref:Uncharacterized protein n=1 Tax=Pycnoporus cinnabarinus TaxID=5643 RepID=A0A060SHC0_PYCCI|nr:hypothetical protein BN946_scf184939.g7 [Trametes cinnabarina]
MASFDALDFMSSAQSPFSPDNDPLFDSYIDSSAYSDQALCSNFSCCGQNLPDLHRLLDHFEEQHVLPFPADNRPIYSSPVYARPAGPHASYILSYPQPNPPLQPVSHPMSSAHGPLRPVPDVHHVPDLIHSPASLASTSVPSSCYASPNPGEPLCLPPSLFSFQPPRASTPPPSSLGLSTQPEDDNLLDSNLVTPISRSAVGPQRSSKQSNRADPLARSRPLAQTPERPTSTHSASRRRDGREKMYKCPSYLNPNGLKYHLEKGTCTNADERPRVPLPASVIAAAMAPGSVSTTPEPPASVAASVSSADSDAGDDAFDDRT